MKAAVRKTLEEMRDQFRNMPCEDIAAISWLDQDPIDIDRIKYYPAVWSQAYGEDARLLLVQLTRWYIPRFFGATDCIGFLCYPNAQTSDSERIDVDEEWLMREIGHP